ncbi:MAG: hypothetical protein LBQ66_00880 [Planctomycetaceae bacterium]|nr:hypothetical protein [Planctomycetaceae bacterium]
MPYKTENCQRLNSRIVNIAGKLKTARIADSITPLPIQTHLRKDRFDCGVNNSVSEFFACYA